jgi:hypothetical protein
MLSGLAGTVMSGMAFGTGSAVAHRAVDAIAGPREVKHVHEGGDGDAAPGQSAAPMSSNSNAGPCGDEFEDFQRCSKENNNDISSCRFFYDVLSQCQDNSKNDSNWK